MFSFIGTILIVISFRSIQENSSVYGPAYDLETNFMEHINLLKAICVRDSTLIIIIELLATIETVGQLYSRDFCKIVAIILGQYCCSSPNSRRFFTILKKYLVAFATSAFDREGCRQISYGRNRLGTSG